MRAAVAEICAAVPQGTIEILTGKLVVEIKPAGVNKANAVCDLMRYPPFAGRNPIFIGDDTTDIPVFAIISKFGGLGFSVGRIVADVNGHFDKPETVRSWLARVVAERRKHGGIMDHGLDLAVIGNGRTAALVDPCARIVWWCFPRFDSDPIFSRLLAGKEEKGFTDIVLDDMVEFQSEYVRNTAIVSTVLTDRQGGKVRITDCVPRFRQFGRSLPAAANIPDRRTRRRTAAYHDQNAADMRLRQAAAAPLGRQQPYPLFRR